ncbi:MAG: ATP-dependent DNA helicase RecG [Candidatus Pacebacteria bacterium]|nr:ATP-dependent DNA helicase RecG [Candidatus Paceibacterota bacterium]
MKRLGITTLHDLLYHFPTRYSDMSEVKTIQEVHADETVTVYGRIHNLKTKKSFKGGIPMATAMLTDIHGDTLSLTWFRQAFLAKTLHEGSLVQLTGKITISTRGARSLVNPEVQNIPHLPIDTHTSLFGEKRNEATSFGFPVYPETKGITSKWIYHALKTILTQELLASLVDPIPVDILQKYNLPTLATALVWVHMPKRKKDADTARKRFAFEEIFMIQIHKQRDRAYFRDLASFMLDVDTDKMHAFVNTFPFPLTGAQERAINEIVRDMASPYPMSRLLEGDVGSGKTAVAVVASYATITNAPRDNRFGRLQVAYMAPTEILAQQHFESFIEYFAHTGISIGLITGSGCRKFPSKVDPFGWTSVSRAQLLKWTHSGEISILIGTHALIQKSVSFHELGLVIIDEQHRFGTKQRMQLSRKQHAPHLLSMTATPIPRTLALTLYGDLDLTILDEMPAGRKHVITEITPPHKRTQAYDAVRAALRQGRQVYIICPRIDEPDPLKEKALQLKSVQAEARRLRRDVFPEYRIDILHSKMTKQKKDEVMEKFYAHDIDILVATSVVEVGVNVPNATVIVIEGAERFGLAQLHQLRGRVLRGTYQAYCYLFADVKTKKTLERLDALVASEDGFALAEKDFALRGAGDLAGRKQWGITDMGMEALKNIKMVSAAREEALRIITEDRDLENYPILAEKIKSQKFDIHLE